MKKQIGLFTAILFAVSTLMVGCKAEVHEHTFAEEWSSDETNHWHAATCGCSDVELQKTEHTFGDWKVIKEATEEAKGTKERVCDICKYKEPAEIAKLDHKHVAGESWKNDDKNHWKECTGCKEQLESAEHEYEWTVTKEATCTEEGSKTGTCKVCKKEVTEKIDVKGHSYSESWKNDDKNHWKECRCGDKIESAEHEYEWTVTKEATCTEEGTKTGTCKVCKKEVTEKIDAKGHSGSWENDDKNHWKECTGCKEKIDVKGHSYSESWTKDASGHWYECVCGAKKDFEEHTYGTWNVTTEPTTNTEGKEERTCSYCGYVDAVVLQPAPEGFRFVKGTTITGTESWTPSSEVFVSGRKLTIPDLIVSDHEVTIGEYKAVMGRDQGDKYGYDKDGNILKPDNALNLPVNYVTWYIAIEYCNKLSIKENLTPCYSINGKTNPAYWPRTTSTLDRAICDWNANGYRLPTEVEWEWLARGGENYIYAGSNTEDDVAWTTDNTNTEGRREIKTKAPNGYGLYDMSGNVYEWCWDWHGNINDTTAADGATWSNTRVRRGGSYIESIVDCGVATRFEYGSPSSSNSDYGFRVVRQAN